MQQAAALKKVRSVDCGQQQQTLVGGPNSSGSQQTAVAGAGSRSGAPLMHSVSIVVELAKDPNNAGSISLESSLDREDSIRDEPFGTGSSQAQPQQQQRQQQYAKEASISPAATTEEDESDDDLDENDDDDDDDDDDEGACLSSNLARKVVIVDEADKILRNRAQSAEPRASCDLDDAHRYRRPACKDDDNDLNGAGAASGGPASGACGNLSATPTAAAAAAAATAAASNNNNNASRSHSSSPAPAEAAVAGARSASAASPLARPISVASGGGGLTSAAYSRHHRLSLAAATSGASPLAVGGSGSGGELAKRAELGKLGMRRNTHHHVNFNPSLAFAGAGGAAAASAAGPLSSGSMRGAINHPVRQHARSGSAQLEHYTVGPLVEALSAKAALGGGAGVAGAGLHGEPGGHRLQQQPLHHFQQQPAAQSPLLLAPLSPGAQNYSQVALSPAGSAKNWSQRRQSLQISLLTGGCSPSKSLTEEELRGEREFNEQVRSSKSPDIFAYRASVASASYQPAALAHPQPAGPATHHSSSQQRCQSVAGGSISEIVGLAEFGAELRQRHQQQQQQQQQRQAAGRADCALGQSIVGEQQGPLGALSASSSPLHQSALLPPPSPQQPSKHQSQQRQQQSRRRVSFSSIDPILARAESQQQQSQQQHQLHLQRHGRASFAFYPLAHYSPAPTATRSHDNTAAAAAAAAAATTAQLLAALANPSRPVGGPSLDTASSAAAAPTPTVTPAPTATTTTATAANSTSLQVTSGSCSGGYIGRPASRSGLSSTAAPKAAERTSCMTSDKHKRHSLASTAALGSSAGSAATPSGAAAVAAALLASLADRAADAAAATGGASGGALASSILAGIGNLAQHQESQQRQTAPDRQSHLVGAASGASGPEQTSSPQLINSATETQQTPSLSSSPSTATSREKPSWPPSPFMFSAGSSSGACSSSSTSSSSSSRDTETIATNTAAAASKAAASSSKMNDNDSFATHTDAAATRGESLPVEPPTGPVGQVKGAELGQESLPMAADSNNSSTDSERKITSTSCSASAPGTVEQTQVVMSPAPQETREDDSRVQSIMANARLRQEEFARLLEEHEQIVNEINRVETKISSSQTNLQQQRQQQEDSKQ